MVRGYQPVKPVSKYEHFANYLLKKINQGPVYERVTPKITPFEGVIRNENPFEKFEKSDIMIARLKHLEGEVIGKNVNLVGKKMKKLDKKTKIKIARQIGQIIGFLHKNNITLCDLTPFNIFIEETPRGPRVRLLDTETATHEGRQSNILRGDSKQLEISQKRIGSIEREKDDLGRAFLCHGPAYFTKIAMQSYEREVKSPWYKFKGKEVVDPHKPRPVGVPLTEKKTTN